MSSVHPRKRLAILLAVVMITLLAVLTVGWVLVNVIGASTNTQVAGVYWTLLSIGSTFIVLLIVGVVMYLALSIKAINLTRRQSNFVDSVTHELKSPIASLKLCLQTLGRRQLSGQEQADFYRFMLEDVERLDRLITRVLDVQRLEAGHVDGELEGVDLEALLRECAEVVSMAFRVPPETIRLDVVPCRVLARRIDLDMIFRNLIENAVKYAGPSPEVLVSAQRDRGWVVVRVSDNGRGIAPELRRKIFGRFVRLGSELERDKPGTGLGLYIVRNLVKRCRGTVRATGQAHGPGAVFEVRLRAEPATEENQGAESASEKVANDGQR